MLEHLAAIDFETLAQLDVGVAISFLSSALRWNGLDIARPASQIERKFGEHSTLGA
jgi:hypothetical protein